jgi:hypothetical protein
LSTPDDAGRGPGVPLRPAGPPGTEVNSNSGGDSGIGYLIILSLATLESADMMVSLIVLSAVGIVLALGVRRLAPYLLLRQPRNFIQGDTTE